MKVQHLISWLVAATILVLVVLPMALAAPPAQAVVCAEEYTVQADDWLSKIADKLLGDMWVYPAIVSATNQKHITDPSFVAIIHPDAIEVGWKLCVPGTGQAQALLAVPQPKLAATLLEPATLTIFAAASLTEAFNEIGQNFSAEHPGVTVTFNFAGSQQLAQQLGQGAPADVFASANTKQMEFVINPAGRVSPGSERTFARNRLVVIYPIDNPAGLTHWQELARPGVKLILAAGEVPVGQYSLDFLAKASQDPALGAIFKDKTLQNVVSYEENVKSVLAKIALGEGDAGIVYTSDISGKGAGRVGRLEIPDHLNTVAGYPIAVIGDSAYPAQAKAFADYVLSPAGQEVLAKYGFTSATDQANIDSK